MRRVIFLLFLVLVIWIAFTRPASRQLSPAPAPTAPSQEPPGSVPKGDEKSSPTLETQKPESAEQAGNSTKEQQAEKNTTQQAIENGVAFLQKKQAPTGEFFFTVCDATAEQKCQKLSSAFFTAVIVDALEYVDDARIAQIKKRAFDFILSDMDVLKSTTTPMTRQGVWRALSKKSSTQMMPYMLEDTFYIGRVLLKNNIDFPRSSKVLDNFKTVDGLFYRFADETLNHTEKLAHANALSISYTIDTDASTTVSVGPLDKTSSSTPQQSWSSFFPSEKYFGVDCETNAYALGYFEAEHRATPQICSYFSSVIKERLYPACMVNPRSATMILAPLSGFVGNCPAFDISALEKALEKQIDSKNIFTKMLAILALPDNYKGKAMADFTQKILSLQKADGSFGGISIDTGEKNGATDSPELVTAMVMKFLSRTLH